MTKPAKKKLGRPPKGVLITQVNVGFPTELLAALDAWREEQKFVPSRQQAIVHLVAEGIRKKD
jgi:hypothetical protein